MNPALGFIPKFTSFRPRPIVKDGDESSDTVKKPETILHDHKEHRHRHHHQHRRRRRSGSREKSHERRRTPAVSESLADIPLKDDTSSLFIEDRRGDIKNLVYGSIHRYDVPIFHRFGAGSILGAWRSLRIDRSYPEDKGVVLTDRQDDDSGKREKYLFTHNEKKTRLLRIRSIGIGSAPTENADFIPLRISNPRKRKRKGSHSTSTSENEGLHYRSIEGKVKADMMPLDEGLEYVTDSDSSNMGFRYDEDIKLKTMELSRRVDDDPQDVQAWIDLIDHQDNILGLGDGGHRNATSAERTSTADIKLHLYQKALAKAGSTLEKRERLLLGMMKVGSQIWDLNTQSQRWEQISQDNLDSICLWKQYLDFRQSTFATFRYEEVRAIFVKRIKLLNEKINNEKNSEEEVCILYGHLLYTILRATLFMREAGYSEIAVAIWQALLELNFFAPPHQISGDLRLEAFREFWESEVPRIGEADSSGWRNFSDSSIAPEGKSLEEIPYRHEEFADMFAEWAVAERFMTKASREPARTMDEATEDDPYRVILWSDIEDFIIDLHRNSSIIELSSLLLNSFLLFCRLPPMNDTDSPCTWWMDAFVRGEILEWSESWVTNKYSAALGATTSVVGLADCDRSDTDRPSVEKQRPLHMSSHYFANSIDSMFPPEYWVSSIEPWRLTFSQPMSSHQDSDSSGPVKYSWLRNALRILSTADTHSNFGEYFLAFEWRNEPSEIKKAAKSLLKQYPQNLRLYNAYSLIERLRGNKETAVNVITAALGMLSSLSEDEQKNAILLRRTWAWALLDDGDITGSLKCLLGIAGGVTELSQIDASSAGMMLKAKQHLSSLRDSLLPTGKLHHAAMYAECLALLAYSSNASGTGPTSPRQGRIEDALWYFDNFSEEMAARGSEKSTAHEILHQVAVRLLVHHIGSGPFRPALLRDRLTKSLTLFPHNTIFLSMYAWNESSLRIDDRVRAILHSLVLSESNDNIIGRLFAICHETRAGNKYSVHAAFEHAVSSPATRSNPGLWRLYIIFCIRTEGFQTKAKEVFYRAVRACPWAKELLTMAFTTELKGLMGFEELRSLYRVLGEKELRLHVDLEDRLEELK